MKVTRFYLIIYNICSVLNYIAIIHLIDDDSSQIQFRHLFGVLQMLIRLIGFKISLDYSKLSFLKKLDLNTQIDLNVFKLNYPKKIDDMELIAKQIMQVIYIIEFSVEVLFLGNKNSFYIIVMILNLLLLGYEYHESWIQSIEFSSILIMSCLLLKQFLFSAGWLCPLYYTFELFLIILSYQYIFRNQTNSEKGNIFVGFTLSCVLGLFLVIQKLNPKNIGCSLIKRQILYVQGFLFLNNIIFGIMFFDRLSIYISSLFITLIPYMIFQVYCQIKYMKEGTYFAQIQVDCQNSSQSLKKLKQFQYFVEMEFSNFSEQVATQYIREFVKLNPKCIYTIQIMKNGIYQNDKTWQEKHFLKPNVSSFMINATSLQKLNFFLETYYISSHMTQNPDLIIDYNQLFTYFTEHKYSLHKVHKILINYDEFKIVNKNLKQNLPSDFLIKYQMYRDSVIFSNIAYQKYSIQDIPMNPQQIFYDLYEDINKI